MFLTTTNTEGFEVTSDRFSDLDEALATADSTGRTIASVLLEKAFPEDSFEGQVLRVLSISLLPLTRSQIADAMISTWGHGMVSTSMLEHLGENPGLRVTDQGSRELEYDFAITDMHDEVRDRFRVENPIAYGAAVSHFLGKLNEGTSSIPNPRAAKTMSGRCCGGSPRTQINR